MTVLVGWGTALATFEAVRPATPTLNTALPRESAPARLANHVLFVVVDGLRWDVANDPHRMPHFAEALRTHTSGQIWAGPISMTSSAVLSYGTGQRGSLEQILENLTPPGVNTNCWLENAHQAGRRLMAVGDPAWVHLYGKWLDAFRPDPEGVGVEADFNLQTFRNASDLIAKSPDFLVAHFVTPDHQGHAYGVKSPRYTRHIREFDQKLFDWLAPLGDDWTVIVTSDHGAADSGTHGTDTDLQRRSPIFAYGPPIRPNLHLSRALDQVELPGLLAALLGVRSAAQGRGLALIDWLDVNSVQKKQLACGEVERLAALGTHPDVNGMSQLVSFARKCCSGAVPDRSCVAEASAVATAYDTRLGKSQGAHSPRNWSWASVVFFAAIGLAFILFGTSAIGPIALGCACLAASLALTYGVERLPGVFPNLVRALILVGANGLLLLGCLRFKHWAPTLGRYAGVTMAVVPGWLLVSYTTDTQIEAYVVVILFAVLLMALHVDGMGLLSGLRSLLKKGNWLDSIALLASIALLGFSGTKTSDICPALLARSPFIAALTAAGLLVLGLFYLMIRGEIDRPNWSNGSKLTYGSIVFALLCLVLRHFGISWVGRAAILATCTGTVVALLTRHARVALAMGVASYALVSRDFEWIAFMPALVVSNHVGRAFAKHFHSEREFHEPLPVAWALMFVTFLFALGMLQRIGLQGGLQLTTPDFAAGTFGDNFTPNWLIAACLTYKFVIAQLLLFVVALGRLPESRQIQVLLGLGFAHLARGVALLLMLLTCAKSYWTAFRVVADLPFALLGIFVVALTIGLCTLQSRTRSEQTELVRLHCGPGYTTPMEIDD
jgi:hypothetical protein